VRGRIGYLMTPTTMLFGTFGWSWSEVEFSNNIVPESFSRSVSGPQVGFGTETMYTANWIIRSEYLHSFYNRAGFSSEVIGRLSASPWVGVIRTAIIYKPGPSAPTAWPDRAPTPIWSGLYVGGLVGPLVASGKLKVPEVGFTGDGVGVSAVVPTALVGYNVLIAPHWLVGVEGEIAPNISTSDIKIEWTGAARVRAGILLTPTVLAYGNVGWGTAGVDNVTRREGSFSIHIERVHAFGWGTGLEAAVSDRWRLRADYQYYVTNKLNLFFPFEGGITGSVRATSQTARLGAIYQLSGP
jgi:outer membrane immunogenic protein